jgi:tRNA(Ile2)-agmatinylcytidine synthase
MCPEAAYEIARQQVICHSETEDEETNPGLVVFDGESPGQAFIDHTNSALHTLLSIEDAQSTLEDAGDSVMYEGWGNKRGLVGATAAIGAWGAMDDFTYEHISYRKPSKWGTEREFDTKSAVKAAEEYYPDVWDTVDHEQDYVLAYPHTPCPILHGVRGDDPEAVKSVSSALEKEEPVGTTRLFHTNQGTDMHLSDSEIGDAEEYSSHKISGTVSSEPEIRKGGHVFFDIGNGNESIQCVAFSPTNQFREYVRDFRVGDELVVCGGVSDGTLKLEKFKAVSLNDTQKVNPQCPDCNVSMGSAGRNQGYRCSKCSNTADSKNTEKVDRNIEPGWYEVPPTARRHIAKPLVRTDNSKTTHCER